MKKMTQIAGLAGIVAVALGFMVGAVQREWSQVVIAHLAAGAVLVLVGAAANAPEIKEALARRGARMGPQTAIQGLLIIAILVLVNAIVMRNDWIKDYTRGHMFTLGKITKDVANNLPGTIQVMAFFPSRGGDDERERLKVYDAMFDKFQLMFIDPDKNEDLARAEGVPHQPGVLFKYKEKSVWITKYEESDITNALIKVTRETEPKVLFTTGHSEPGLDSQSPNGLSRLKEMLEQQGYSPSTADLSTMRKIPEDVSMIAVVGPSIHFTPEEIKVLDYYLATGGNAAFFIDPVFDMRLYTGIEPFLDAYGVRLRWNVVLDRVNHMSQDSLGLQLVAKLKESSHPISSDVSGDRVVFYLSRAMVEAEQVTAQTNLTPLVVTHDTSFERFIDPQVLMGMTDSEKTSEYVRDLLSGEPGPNEEKGTMVLAYAVQKNNAGLPEWKKRDMREDDETRLVVFGSSAVCRNMSIYMPYNYELIINSFNWLAGEGELKGIRSPRRAGTRMFLDEKQKDGILYISVLILPEFFMIVGLAAWWRRR